MWRFSKKCCSRNLLRSSGYQCFILRSETLDAVAWKVRPDSASLRSPNIAARLPSPWFALSEDDSTVPIFIKPTTVNSPQLTDQFGLLCIDKPSASADSSSGLESGPFAAACIPTTLVEHAEESRLVNSPQMWMKESESGVDPSDISRIFENFREFDGDSGTVRLFGDMAQSNERIAPNMRRRSPVAAVRWWSWDKIRRIRYAKNHRLLAACRMLRFSKALSSQMKVKTVSTSSGLNETKIERSDVIQNDRSGSTIETVQQPRPAVVSSPTLSEATEAPKKQGVMLPGPAVSSTLFDPLEVRTEQDVEGLRVALNEHYWPHFESMRDFICELFEVFIEKGLNVDEVKRLMWDFAATNNRAYVRDSVTLSLLERIVREEGVEAATNYARLNRDLFLVKAPMERRSSKFVSQLSKRLFATVFQSNTDDNQFECARKLLDTLMDLGYINNSSAFLLNSVAACLKTNGFAVAQKVWMSNVLKYRTTLGSHVLLKAILEDKSANQCVKQQRLSHILSVCEQYEHPFAGLAELIVELCVANLEEDAQYLLMRDSLVHVERFAKLINECIHPKQKRRPQKKANEQSSSDCLESREMHTETDKTKGSQEEGSIGNFIVNRMLTKKGKRSPKNRKAKRHKADVEKLHELALIVQRIWGDLAETIMGEEALKMASGDLPKDFPLNEANLLAPMIHLLLDKAEEQVYSAGRNEKPLIKLNDYFDGIDPNNGLYRTVFKLRQRTNQPDIGMVDMPTEVSIPCCPVHRTSTPCKSEMQQFKLPLDFEKKTFEYKIKAWKDGRATLLPTKVIVRRLTEKEGIDVRFAVDTSTIPGVKPFILRAYCPDYDPRRAWINGKLCLIE
ncbi:hypothetical protein Tcan_16777 [Toxocara canis]|uniref:Uncharacterized protein n=1 Tax=Toxocara canis TaxID=6265 RepID=A0A0B2UXR7_TOXCA|nr:hypothetical protein Tcan_16777 [Toxocara canis]